MTTTIHRLARSGDPDGVEAAVCAGADVDEKDEFGATALHYSISESNPEVARRLIDLGANVNIQDDQGRTPLHYAVEYSSVDVIQSLLTKDSGCLATADVHGNQPLWTAVFCARGSFETVEQLLRYGANANHKNNTDKSPIDLAKQMNQESLLKLLEGTLSDD